MRWLPLVVALAGCATMPTIPDDATVAEGAGGLDGLRLHAWIEAHPDRLRLSAVLEATAGVHQVRVDCGRPWDSRILDADDRNVSFVDRLACHEFYYDELREGQFLEYRYSWDKHEHDIRNGSSGPVPEGEYLWTIRADTLDKGGLSAAVPFRIGEPPAESVSDGDGALAGLRLTGRYDAASQTVHARVENVGDASYEYSRGCLHEWSLALFDADGEVDFRGAGGTCAGFAPSTLGPGDAHAFNYTWSGQVYPGADGEPQDAPPGDYAWEVRFHTGHGSQGEPSVAVRVPFTVS